MSFSLLNYPQTSINTHFKYLVESGKTELDSRGHSGQTPLSRAAENRHHQIVKFLIDSRIVKVDSRNVFGRTSLSWATAEGHESIDDCQTQFSRATAKGYEEVARLLFDARNVDNN